MSNLFKMLQQTNPNIAVSVSSSIIKTTSNVDPVQAARAKVLEKIRENILVIDAINSDSEIPVHKGNEVNGKVRTRKYAKWFYLDNNSNTFEIEIKYGAKPIFGIFGQSSDGESYRVMSGITKENLKATFEQCATFIESGEVDDLLVAARSQSAPKRKQKV